MRHFSGFPLHLTIAVPMLERAALVNENNIPGDADEGRGRGENGDTGAGPDPGAPACAPANMPARVKVTRVSRRNAGAVTESGNTWLISSIRGSGRRGYA